MKNIEWSEQKFEGPPVPFYNPSREIKETQRRIIDVLEAPKISNEDVFSLAADTYVSVLTTDRLARDGENAEPVTWPTEGEIVFDDEIYGEVALYYEQYENDEGVRKEHSYVVIENEFYHLIRDLDGEIFTTSSHDAHSEIDPDSSPDDPTYILYTDIFDMHQDERRDMLNIFYRAATTSPFVVSEEE